MAGETWPAVRGAMSVLSSAKQRTRPGPGSGQTDAYVDVSEIAGATAPGSAARAAPGARSDDAATTTATIVRAPRTFLKPAMSVILIVPRSYRALSCPGPNPGWAI